MKGPPTFKINVTEKFKQLPRAPIAEAVIQWQATPSRTLEQTPLHMALKEKFPDFSSHIHQGLELEAQFAPSPQSMELRQRSKWDGIRLTSADHKYVCQFKPNTVVFSRLAPYEGWESFRQAAAPFWQTFLE